MPSTAANLVLLLPSLFTFTSAETVLGVYMFHRHGDRTSKSTPPTNLTDLGYNQVYNSGQYYRSRYVSSEATSKIYGLNTDLVLQSQIQASAPSDVVLQNSATGFLQGLYPAVGATLSAQTLANGSTIDAPMNGYQLIPVALQETNTGSEDAGWLQSATDCNNAEISSNQYYYTPEYTSLLSSTQDFYTSLLPVINGAFNAGTDSFKNAYTLFDYLNVASLHNTSIPSGNLVTNSTLAQLSNLANTHEYNLAYNASSPIRGISGMILAGQVLSFLNTTATTSGKRSAAKFGVQFGAYATFMSLFGLMGLDDDMWKGIPGYASAATFELFTDADEVSTFPSVGDMQVRFFWHNGTTLSGDDLTPEQYAMFGTNSTSLAWSDFYSRMSSVAVLDDEQWCTVCGNTTGSCAAYASETSSSTAGAAGAAKSGSMSNAVAGVIGAMVALAFVFGAEALVLLLGGWRMVKKGKWAPTGGNGVGYDGYGNQSGDVAMENVGPVKRA